MDYTDPADYPESAEYREEFAEWLGNEALADPAAIAEARAAATGLPGLVADLDDEAWSEFVWNDLPNSVIDRLVADLAVAMRGTYSARPEYAEEAARWASDNRDAIDEDARINAAEARHDYWLDRSLS